MKSEKTCRVCGKVEKRHAVPGYGFMNCTLECEFVKHICCTSIDYAKSSIETCTIIENLERCLEYEKKHRQRKTMINALTSRIKKLNKEQNQ